MRGRPILVVIVLALLAATQAQHVVVVAFVLPLLGGLLAIELDRRGGHISRRLVRIGARVLPGRDRDNFRDEWLDHVACAGEHGVAPLTRAFSIVFIAAPLLGIGLRVGRARKPRATL